MSLTKSYGPLSASPPSTNYRIDGPAHRILVHDVDKRIRVEFAGETVADTTEAKLLHESNLLPVYYLPVTDVAEDLLERTDHATHCAFKGDASYWSIRVGDAVAEDALWGYEDPDDELRVLEGHVAVYLDKVDAVYEEDERLPAHPRDPFHRVDVRRSSRHVRVVAGDRVLAESTRAKGVFETGLPARWYVPTDDVDLDRLRPATRRPSAPTRASRAGGRSSTAPRTSPGPTRIPTPKVAAWRGFCASWAQASRPRSTAGRRDALADGDRGRAQRPRAEKCW